MLYYADFAGSHFLSGSIKALLKWNYTQGDTLTTDSDPAEQAHGNEEGMPPKSAEHKRL